MPAAVSTRAIGASKVAVHLLLGSARCRSDLGESGEERGIPKSCSGIHEMG